MGKIKLEIELIPKTCHYQNARNVLKASQWDTVRRYTYQKAHHVCEICKKGGHQQGYKNNLECHEIWEFDKKTRTQKLAGLIALCPLCHQTKHFGLASIMGKQSQVIQQLMKINKWDFKDVMEHVAKTTTECEERSQYEWKLDLTILTKKPFGFLINKKFLPKLLKG
jgi:HNH endonuclease